MSIVETQPTPPEAGEPKKPAVRPAAAPAGPVQVDPLNLSRRPFLNSRPVVRVSLILLLLGLGLLLVNVTLFWSYLSSSEDKRAEIARGTSEIQKGQGEVRELESRLDRIDLTDLNAEIVFLNSKIQERTFSFNQLLDDLARVLPNDVRLRRLNPQTGDQRRGETGGSARGVRRPVAQEGQVPLMITGETRDLNELDRFVQNLFSPPFSDPNLIRYEQADDQGSLVSFEVTVLYVPARRVQGQDVVIEEVPVVEEKAPAADAQPAPAAPGGRP